MKNFLFTKSHILCDLPSRNSLWNIAVVCALLCCGNSALLAQKYVKQTATGTGDGSSWDNALGKAGLRAAVEAHGTVYIAAGTYDEAAPAGHTSTYIELTIGTTPTKVIGGFPANATGTDLSGYNPTANITLMKPISAASTYRFMYQLGAGGDLLVKGLVIDGFKCGGDGSGIYCTPGSATGMKLEFIDNVFKNLGALSQGAGCALYLTSITNVNSSITVDNCVFDTNKSSEGAAIRATTVYSSASYGGGDITPDGKHIISNCRFINNQTSSHGTVYLTTSHGWYITNSCFTNNSSTLGQGGGIYFTTSHANKMTGCNFSNNTVQGYGGAFVATTASVDVHDSKFVGNTCTNNYGGAVFATTATAFFDNCQFFNNTATNSRGGAIFGTTADVTATNCTFKGNAATSGAAYFSEAVRTGVVTKNFTNSVFYGNTNSFSTASLTEGGAVVINNGTHNFDNCKFVNNTTNKASGGAIKNSGAKAIFANATFFGNSFDGSTTVLGADIISTIAGTASSHPFDMTTSALQSTSVLYATTNTYFRDAATTYSNTTNPVATAPTTPTITCPASPAFGTFAFNCGAGLTVTGSFSANGSAQIGSVVVPITFTTEGSVSVGISGTNFSGSTSVYLTAGTTSVTVPVTYDGNGVIGVRTIAVASAQGTGSCSASTTITDVIAPGGVKSNLKLWLKADNAASITQASGKVSNWVSSGSTLAVSQATAAKQPSFTANAINFNPALDFNGTSNCLRKANLGTDVFVTATDASTMMAMCTNRGLSTDAWRDMINFNNNSTFPGLSLNWYTQKLNTYYSGLTAADHLHGTAVVPEIPTFAYARASNTASGTVKFGMNDLSTQKTDNTFGTYAANQNHLDIGAEEDGVREFHSGLMPEVIVYNRELTDPEMQRVQSYIAVKYGLTIAQDYLASNGTTKWWNKTTNATYHNNVFGIGYEAAQALYQKQSKSVNDGFQPILSTTGFAATNATNGGSLADATFEMAGSDNGAASFGLPFVFGNANTRMNRIWKVQETGIVGTIKVLIEKNDMPGINPSLLRSTTTTFTAASMIAMTTTTVGGIQYYTADVNFADGDFFTFSTFITAPGCVTAGLQMWMNADAGVTQAAGKVSKWTNQALGFSLTQATATAQPAFSANGMNFNPVLDFNGAQALGNTTAGNTVFPSTTNPATILSVSTNRSSLASWKTLVSFGGAFDHPSTHWYGTQLNSYVDGVSNFNMFHTPSFAFDTPTLFGAIYPNVSPQNIKLYSNGLFNIQSFTGITGTFTAGGNGLLTVGAENAAGSVEPLNGLMSEAIVYNRVLTNDELMRVNTYLGIRYGIQLSDNYVASDGTTVIWDKTANAAFHNRVAGIGREDCQGLNQKQSKSVNAGALVTMGIDNTIAVTNALNGGDFLNDVSFLVWGDNNATGTTTVTSGTACTPPSVDKATNRAFKVVETGTVESVKIAADLTSFGFNSAFPVYMQIATDAAFASIVANVPMTLNGAAYETNYDFTANSASYIRFTGNTTLLANICTGNKTLNWTSYLPFDWWSWGTRTKNYNIGDQQFQVSVTDPSNRILHPTWYPVSYGNYMYMPRYDNPAGGNDKITTTIKLRDAGTPANAKPAQAVDFKITDLDGFIGGRDVVNIYGKLAGATVNPKLSRNKYTAVTLNSPTQATGGTLPWDWSWWGQLYVNFDSPVDEIYIEYNKVNTYPFKVFNDLAIGHLNITCAAPVPQVVLPDNIYVFKEVSPNPYRVGEEFTYKFTVQNLNCGNKTVDLSDVLPANVTWADSTLASSMTIATTNGYGGTANLNLTGIDVPPGTSYIYVDAVASAAGTYNNQASFTVNTHTYLSDEPSIAGATNPTPIVITAALPVAPITMTKAVNKPTVLQNGIVTYTYTLSNSGGASVLTSFTDNLQGEALYVASSLSSSLGGATMVSAYANESVLTIRDITVPANGSVSFTINANVGTTPVATNLQNVATMRPDPTGGFQNILTTSNTVGTVIAAPLAITAPSAANVATNAAVSANAGTQLATTGGVGAYIYSNVTTTCTQPGSATQLPAGSNLTVTDPATGAYTYTAPATAGTYYYCIQVCDNSTPTASCVTATYTINVTSGTPLTVSIPPVKTPIAGGGTQSGNAGTELNPQGGTPGPGYMYTNVTTTCTPVLGASQITLTALDANTGAYSYTTPATAGTYYYCIKVCDNGAPTPQCVTTTYTVNVVNPLVVAPPAPQTPPAGGPPQTITPTAPTGGTAPYTYSNVTATCTPVLGASQLTLTSLDVNTGVVTYNTPATAGTYYYCIKVCDNGAPQQCVTTTYTVNVQPAASTMTVPPPAPLTPVAGSGPQTGTISPPSGGTPGYTHTNGSGLSTCTVPGSATLLTPVTVNSAAGTFNYTTPTVAGTYYFCIQTCDNSVPEQCVNTTYTVNVQPAACAAAAQTLSK